MEVRAGFDLNGQNIRPRLREILDVPVGVLDHKMNVQGKLRDLAHRLDHKRPDRDIGHEPAVHDIDVDPVRTGVFDRLDLVTQPAEIRG